MGVLTHAENLVDLIGAAAVLGAPLWWPIFRLWGLPLFNAKARCTCATSIAWYLCGVAIEGGIIALVAVLQGPSAILLGPLLLLPLIAVVVGARKDPLFRSSP